LQKTGQKTNNFIISQISSELPLFVYAYSTDIVRFWTSAGKRQQPFDLIFHIPDELHIHDMPSCLS
jgi:hypothetical protein